MLDAGCGAGAMSIELAARGARVIATDISPRLLDDARGLIRTDPHLVWFPGLAIVVTVLCVNYLGDGLRDALDPRQTRNKA